MASAHLRRLLIGGAGVGTCAAAVFSFPNTPVQPIDRPVKIGMLQGVCTRSTFTAIIGAGIGGTSCAYFIRQSTAAQQSTSNVQLDVFGKE